MARAFSEDGHALSFFLAIQESPARILVPSLTVREGTGEAK